MLVSLQFCAETMMEAEMATLTPADIECAIGSIEDHEVARIIGSGATAGDLADAISCMQTGPYVAGKARSS
jgi:hypothetical protein